MAIVGGRVRNIGLGVVTPPQGTTITGEGATLFGASRNGYAVGISSVTYTDENGLAGVASSAFHWSEERGAVPIPIDAPIPVFIPTAVNSAGIVVGYAGAGGTGSLRAYVWSQASGHLRDFGRAEARG